MAKDLRELPEYLIFDEGQTLILLDSLSSSWQAKVMCAEQKLKFIDLFAGLGGFTWPWRNSGMNVCLLVKQTILWQRIIQRILVLT